MRPANPFLPKSKDYFEISLNLEPNNYKEGIK